MPDNGRKNRGNEYITRLSRLNQKAGQLMRQYIDTHGTGDADALITYAAALVTKYGEGSAELACQMYDALAEAANAGVPAAEPAEPADYGEVARMVNATKNQNPANLPNGVSRLVKRAGADTTLKKRCPRRGRVGLGTPRGHLPVLHHAGKQRLAESQQQGAERRPRRTHPRQL